MTKADQVRQIIKNNPGLRPAEIAKKANTSLQYVYTTMYLDRKAKGIRKHKPKQAAKAVAPKPAAKAKHPENSGEIVIQVESFNKIALEDQIVALKKEIDELTVIIAYLEHRVKVAEAKHGATV